MDEWLLILTALVWLAIAGGIGVFIRRTGQAGSYRFQRGFVLIALSFACGLMLLATVIFTG